MNSMKKTNSIVHFFIALMTSCLINSAYAEESSKELLSEALKASSSINGSAPTKQRIESYKTVFSSIEGILSKFPASDEAIQILSGQSIGNFNVENIRVAYIEDLSTYYNTVCQASPSFECLAFVSLKEGADGCESSENFNELMNAHDQLQNSITIFSGQKSDPSFIDLAMGTYRSCADKSKFQIDQWQQDAFSSYLIPTLISLDNEAGAKATVQSMKTPFFKFRGATQLKEGESDPANQAYIDRLDQFIGTRMDGSDAFLATLELRKFAIESSLIPIEYSFAYAAIQRFRHYGDRACNGGGYQDFLVNNLLQYGLALESLPKNRQKVTSYQRKLIYAGAADRIAYVLDAYSDSSEAKLSTKLKMALYVASLEGAASGTEFWNQINNKSISEVDLYDIYLTTLQVTKDEINAALDDSLSESFGSYEPMFYKKGRFVRMLRNEAATFPVYKILVDAGDVCASTKMLFKKLSSSDLYDEAISYMVNSPSIDPSRKYQCGDEDLELLLM